MKLHIFVFAIAILSTGYMAGIFFTWTNAVTPGIGKLSDLAYLTALQEMNRVILNPTFYIAFICPVLSIPLATYLNYNFVPGHIFITMLAASLIYLSGSFIVTAVGNIPLNELLDKAVLGQLDTKELSELRTQIEQKWNAYNLIRTLSSLSAFILLIYSSFFIESD